ncbi:hypothetical protein D3C78_600790 [compost metagenome]
MRRIQSAFDIVSARARKLGNRPAIDRRRGSEIFSVDRTDELAVDKVAVAKLEGNLGTFSTGMCVAHYCFLVIVFSWRSLGRGVSGKTSAWISGWPTAIALVPL